MATVVLAGCSSPERSFHIRVENQAEVEHSYVLWATLPEQGHVVYVGNLTLRPEEVGWLEPNPESWPDVGLEVRADDGRTGSRDLQPSQLCGSCRISVVDSGTRIAIYNDVFD